MSDSRSPRRIACLQPSATVILASVGELERVVACTKYCADVVPELREYSRHIFREEVQDRVQDRVQGEPRRHVRAGNRPILVIADSWTSKATEILAAQPDLVIASVPYQQAAVIEILKAGIRFLGLAPRTLDDIYTDIALISGSVGAGERGTKVFRTCKQPSKRCAGRRQTCPESESSAKSGANRSSHRSPGFPNWCTRLEGTSWALRERSVPRKRSLEWIRRSSSPPGAAPGIECRWPKSLPGEAGRTQPQSGIRRFIVFPTNF